MSIEGYQKTHEIHLRIFDEELAQTLLDFVAQHADRIRIERNQIVLGEDDLSLDRLSQFIDAYHSKHPDISINSITSLKNSLQRTFDNMIEGKYITALLDETQTIENSDLILMFLSIRNFGEKRLALLREVLKEAYK